MWRNGACYAAAATPNGNCAPVRLSSVVIWKATLCCGDGREGLEQRSGRLSQLIDGARDAPFMAHALGEGAVAKWVIAYKCRRRAGGFRR